MAAAYATRLCGAANPNYRDAHKRTCARCRREFKSYNKGRKYCSRSCYVEAFFIAMGRTRARRDSNHVSLVTAFRRLGWSVLDLADAGRGIPDIVIGDGSHGTHFVEIKNAKTAYGRAGLSTTQRAFEQKWGGVVHVVRSLDDVVALTERLTGKARADRQPFKTVKLKSVEDVERFERGEIDAD
jgi:hypothetical protein